MKFTPVNIIPDISFWQDDNNTVRKVDFVKMRTQTNGVIIRAGQHTWIDEDVIFNWQAAKQAKLLRGSYWFYDSRSSPQAQADLWKAALGNDLPEWGLWIDLEENYGGFYQGEANWKRFAEAVRVNFPNTKIGIYTGFGWWSSQTVQQNDYWASFPLWLAWYTSNVEVVIIPKPWITKGVTLWQHTDKGDGLKYGTESLNIDLSKTSQAFYDLFGGGQEVPPADTITPSPDGTKLIRGERYGCKIYVDIVDPEKAKRLEVRNSYDLPSNIAKVSGAYLAWNGDDWNRTTLQPVDNNEPSLMIFPDRLLSIGNNHNTIGYTYHSSGLRYLVQAGVNKIPPNGTEAKYTERHARSITGLSVDGLLIHLTIDGDYPDKGVLLWEAAEIMRSFGATTAFDQGGGGDSVEVVSGAVVNVPDDDINGVHYERKVPQTILVFVNDGGSMPETFDTYEYTPKKSDPNDNATARTIRVSWGARSARIASYSDFLFNTFARGQALPENRHVLSTGDVLLYGGAIGDIWVQLYDNAGHAISGWTAKTHMGVLQIVEKFIPAAIEPPPAETGDIAIDMTLKSDGTITGSWTST